MTFIMLLLMFTWAVGYPIFGMMFNLREPHFFVYGMGMFVWIVLVASAALTERMG